MSNMVGNPEDRITRSEAQEWQCIVKCSKLSMINYRKVTAVTVSYSKLITYSLSLSLC